MYWTCYFCSTIHCGYFKTTFNLYESILLVEHNWFSCLSVARRREVLSRFVHNTIHNSCRASRLHHPMNAQIVALCPPSAHFHKHRCAPSRTYVPTIQQKIVFRTTEQQKNCIDVHWVWSCSLAIFSINSKLLEFTMIHSRSGENLCKYIIKTG